jgi:hypothetical protein
MRDWQREVWQAFSRACRALRESYTCFLRSLAVPVAILIALAFAFESSVLLSLAILLVYSIVAVRVHRIVLLGPSAMKTPELPRMRDIKYAVTFLVITLMAGVPWMLIIASTVTMTGGSLSPWAVRVGAVLVLYIVARFSLVLPSIAIDDSLRLFRAFSVSRAHQLSLFLVVGVLPLVLSFTVTYGVVVPLDWAFGAVAAGIGAWIAYFPAMILEIAVLSGLFQHIRETRAQQA